MRIWRWLRALVFVGQMYLAMLIVGLIYAPWAILDRRGAFAAIRAYCRWVRLTAWLICGLRSEIRGEIPQGEVLIASKHQSFFDIIILGSVLPRPKFIMKQQLVRTPVLGWFALRVGCVPVDRGRRGAAVAQMLRDVSSGNVEPGQLIIYPQGTRTAPGAHLPYKVGAGALYTQLNQHCVPAATNVGVFWPRTGIRRDPGLAVLEFLPPIAPGLKLQEFMGELEQQVEAASNTLMAEAGFRVETGDDTPDT
ncbi:MAG: lysophospholipid acyltransferase family protein [Mangrovicoccus sp.]